MLNLKGRTPEELIIVGVALVSLGGQIPFGIYRFSMGDWFLAGIELFGVLLGITAIYQVLRYRRVWLFGPIMAVAAVLGLLLIVKFGEATSAHFIYPVCMMSFFLLKPERALGLTGFAVVALAWILYPQIEVFHLSTLLLSLIGCSLFAFLFAKIRNRQSEQLLLLSSRDPLTGVLNRRSLDERLAQFVLQQKRQAQEAVLIILDLDNFKQVNDRYGHGTGDEVLKRVANTIAARIRGTDLLYRYGGDEFVVFVPDAALSQALGLAEDLRARVEATEAMEGSDISISLGLSAYSAGQTATEWLDAADGSLLRAKTGGRNQVVA